MQDSDEKLLYSMQDECFGARLMAPDDEFMVLMSLGLSRVRMAGHDNLREFVVLNISCCHVTTS